MQKRVMTEPSYTIHVHQNIKLFLSLSCPDPSSRRMHSSELSASGLGSWSSQASTSQGSSSFNGSWARAQQEPSKSIGLPRAPNFNGFAESLTLPGNPNIQITSVQSRRNTKTQLPKPPRTGLSILGADLGRGYPRLDAPLAPPPLPPRDPKASTLHKPSKHP